MMDMREYVAFPRPPSTKEEIYDPGIDAWKLACALVGEYGSYQYNTYRKFYAQMGDDQFRDVLDVTRCILAESTTIKCPVTIQMLGVQDQTTFEQNAFTVGHTLLVQGRNLKLNPSNEGERLFLKNAGHEYEGTVVASTQGTIDATFPSDMVPGVYDLWIHGRAGLGVNRMLVSAKIAGITVKNA